MHIDEYKKGRLEDAQHILNGNGFPSFAKMFSDMSAKNTLDSTDIRQLELLKQRISEKQFMIGVTNAISDVLKE